VASITPSGITSVTRADGATVITNPDGCTLTKYADGMTVQKCPDGMLIVKFADGYSVSRWDDGYTVSKWPDGHTIGKWPNGYTTMKWPDGYELSRAPSTYTVRKWPDGYQLSQAPGAATSIANPDGTVVTKTIQGTTVYKSPDGTVSVQGPDGSKIYDYPDGSVYEQQANGTKILGYTDGARTVIKPDGTTIYEVPGGYTRVIHRDGSAVTRGPNGYKVTTRTDGYKVIEKPTGESSLYSVASVNGFAQKADEAGFGMLSPGMPPVSFVDLLKSKAISFKLVGNGQSTTKFRLDITNHTNKQLVIMIPADLLFAPDKLTYQRIMTVSNSVTVVDAIKTASTTVSAVCVSPKIVAPPPVQGAVYQLAAYPDQSLARLYVRIIDAADDLEGLTPYSVSLTSDIPTRNLIAQLAIWQHQAAMTGVAEDKVTEQDVEKYLLQQSGQSTTSLTPEQKTILQNQVQEIRGLAAAAESMAKAGK
jgi:hypothetical protein